MRATYHGDQAHSWPTLCDEILRIFLTAPPSYDPLAFHLGPGAKRLGDRKLATSSMREIIKARATCCSFLLGSSPSLRPSAKARHTRRGCAFAYCVHFVDHT